jgi:hypothetical protein
MKRNNLSLREYFSTIQEIATRNEVPILKVAGVYIGFNNKIYAGDLSTIGRLKYNPLLEEKTFKLTERYLDKQRVRELNKLK